MDLCLADDLVSFAPWSPFPSVSSYHGMLVYPLRLSNMLSATEDRQTGAELGNHSPCLAMVILANETLPSHSHRSRTAEPLRHHLRLSAHVSVPYLPDYIEGLEPWELSFGREEKTKSQPPSQTDVF